MKKHLKSLKQALSRRTKAARWYHNPLPLPLVMALAYLFLMSPVSAKPSPALVNSGSACQGATAAVERIHRIPRGLLGAISLTESGQWDKNRQAQIAWPWTVYAQGRGRYLANKAAAIKEVRRLKARGVKNIDVGCMQVNLKYHPKAFASLEAAFDPVKNADYAAGLLKSLFQRHRGWSRAVEFYHSSTPKFRLPYRQKVMRVWNQTRRQSFAARSQAARQSYNAKRKSWLKTRGRTTRARFVRVYLKPRLAQQRLFRNRPRAAVLR